jgi:spore maturation protein CgeB
MDEGPMPRVLLVGNFWDWSMEWSYVRAFRHLGVEVSTFDWWRESLAVAPRLAERRFMWQLLGPAANRRLRDRVAGDRPDLVLVFKGLLLRRETVEAIRATGCAAFCLNPDNPFNPSLTSTRKELHEAISAWDCYFTWGRFLIDRLYSVGAKRVEFLPFAWDPERHPFQVPAATSRYGVTFVGSRSEHRERWLHELGDFDLHIWGPGWSNARRDVRKHVRGSAVTWIQFSDIVRDSAASLNILNPWNIPGHNMRTFEIPGCGGLQLSNATSEIADLFEPGKQGLLFHTAEGLREQASWALGNPSERNAIALAGHGRAAGETYLERARGILEVWSQMG